MDLQFDSYFFLYVTKCTKVASCTFAVLEIFSTLPEEVNFVWPTKMNAMKAIFLMNKYSPLVDTTLGIIVDLCTYDSKSCAIRYQVLAYSYVVGILFSEFILMARTMALWGFNKFVVILLAGAAVEMIPLVLWVVHNILTETTYPTTEVLHTIGCVPDAQDQDAWPAYMCMILAETGIVVLTLLKQYMNPVGEGSFKSVLFETMYCDGLFFYAIVLFISVVNVLMMSFAPPELSSSIQMPLRVIHSALCTRVLLNLRKAASASYEVTLNDTLSKHTTIAFNSSSSEPVDSDDE